MVILKRFLLLFVDFGLIILMSLIILLSLFSIPIVLLCSYIKHGHVDIDFVTKPTVSAIRLYDYLLDYFREKNQ